MPTVLPFRVINKVILDSGYEIYEESEKYLKNYKQVNSTRGMDNFDMLNLQLDTAKRKLEYAISKRIPKVVFIHGVGEGVLKERLHDELKKHAHVKHFNNNWQQQFGFGATEIFLK